MADEQTGPEAQGAPPARRSSPKKWIGLGVIVIGAIALITVGYFHWRHGQIFPSTEDAYVHGDVFAVASRVLCRGNLVPSVRELARELAINPNTVARAYQQLQSDGVLQTVRGMGLEVAADAEAHCRTERQKLIRTRIRQALSEAGQSGLNEGELRTLIDEELSGVLAERR